MSELKKEVQTKESVKVEEVVDHIKRIEGKNDCIMLVLSMFLLVAAVITFMFAVTLNKVEAKMDECIRNQSDIDLALDVIDNSVSGIEREVVPDLPTWKSRKFK